MFDGRRAGATPTGTGVLGMVGSWPGMMPKLPELTGVYGESSFGDRPTSRRGVVGVSTPGWGVSGISETGRGVSGQATSGYGIRGQATTGAAGYFATTDPKKGYALRAVGRVKLDKCAGVATIAAGSASVLVTPGIDLTSTSAVVATLQGNAGAVTTTVSRCFINATANTFTIYLTANATQSVKVAWHVFG